MTDTPARIPRATEDCRTGVEGETRTLWLPRSLTYTWQPHEDITAYELALCTPLMAVGTTTHGWMQMNSMYEVLPAKAKRHWRVEETRTREVFD